jgi:hypothetical protein
MCLALAAMTDRGNGSFTMAEILSIASRLVRDAASPPIDRLARRKKPALICWFCENHPDLIARFVQSHFILFDQQCQQPHHRSLAQRRALSRQCPRSSGRRKRQQGISNGSFSDFVRSHELKRKSPYFLSPFLRGHGDGISEGISDQPGSHHLAGCRVEVFVPEF